jgi:hypothetical protein
MREFFFVIYKHLQPVNGEILLLKEHETAPSHAFLGYQPRILIPHRRPKSTIKSTPYDEDPEAANRFRTLVAIWIINQSKLNSWRNFTGA